MTTCERDGCTEAATTRFCSRSCSNSAVPRRKKSAVQVIPCAGCGIDTTNDKFCSVQCPRTLLRSYELEEAKTATTIIGSNLKIKSFIAEDRGFGCEICTITEWLDQPVLLILDHIDGNSSNHTWSNLRTICSNCDAQLPTYKARNRGQGRAKRRERYAQGLTY
jgi:hypothetical protein